MNRKKYIEEILKGFGSIKRRIAGHGGGFFHSKKINITNSQWVVLHLVHQHKLASVKELASQIGISSSATTQLVDGLVENGYLGRQEGKEDRRISELSLTPKARAHFSEVRAKGLLHFSKLFDGLDDGELEQFSILIKKISDNFQNGTHGQCP